MMDKEAIVYSNVEEPPVDSDRKQWDKRRSFLQQPKTYVSKLPAPPTAPTPARTLDRPSSKPIEAHTPRTLPIPIPQSCPVSQNSFTANATSEPQEFFIGDRVTIGGIKTGTLLYFGPTHIADGLWCGISLDTQEGNHDGLVNDVRYFTCRKGHGIFAPVERVSHLDSNVVLQVIKSPPRVSQIPAKPKVCYTSPLLRDEIGYQDRSAELLDDIELPDIEGDLLDLDDDGILHDDTVVKANKKAKKIKRKLPHLPGPSSGIAKLSCTKDMSHKATFDSAEETEEKFDELDSDSDDLEELESNRAFSMDEKECEVGEMPHSAEGSSGGEDSWSLNKDYLAMCDGKAKYLNITFDGESESKTSTQEPSEESPSPEFIFDQEMIEDGEFASQPMEMSRDSSLGILSSFTLEKNELLSELFGDEEDDDLVTSQDTLEPVSEEKDSSPEKTPERQTDFNSDMDFACKEVATSTPFTAASAKQMLRKNLNETYDKDFDEEYPVQIGEPGKECLNSTFTQESAANSTFTLESAKTNAETTFTVEDDGHENDENSNSNNVMKDSGSSKGPMIDSGISMRGSMSESSNFMKGSVMETSKYTMLEPGVRRSMLDSGISMQYAFVESSNGGMVDSTNKVSVGEKTRDSWNGNKLCFVEDVINKNNEEGVGKKPGTGAVMWRGVDDARLMQDLTDGHEKKERPISFLSTTSADTGYVPDTDSELGTLTLNSPQEWQECHLPGQIGVRNQGSTHTQGVGGKNLFTAPVESDTDQGHITADTDGEYEVGRSEVITTDNDFGGSSKVIVTTDVEEESGDEVTQIEDAKGFNTTVTLESTSDNETFTADTAEPLSEIDADDNKSSGRNSNLDGTFTFNEENIKPSVGPGGDTSNSLDMVTIVIQDKDTSNKVENTENSSETKPNKQKTPKKKRFNVVKDFKKPNTTNVVSALAEYLKTPLPVKIKEDKNNTEEMKNKKNTLKTKIDLSKVTSKYAVKSNVDEKKSEVEKKESPEAVEKEVKKLIKRTPPKSKWDAIMNKIENQKETDEKKPKAEVKSKLKALLEVPPPPPPQKKEEIPKPKLRISSMIPDYSKVQSKLKYTAPPPVPKARKDESPNRTNNKKSESPRSSKNLSPSGLVPDSPKRKPLLAKTDSLTNKPGSESTSNKEEFKKPLSKEEGDITRKERRLSKRLSLQNERVRNLSGDSVKRPDVKDKAAHIDLADSLDGRGSSRAGSRAVTPQSMLSSRQGSCTDMSTTEDEAFTAATVKQLPGIQRAQSLQDRRDSSSAVSDTSEGGSHVTSQELECRLQKAGANQQRRKSALLPPTNSSEAKSSIRGRGRNQNRNKTTKSKKEVKVVETVSAEIHAQEVQRLEALCETRTKQLNMVRLQLQTSNLGFEGMATTVNYLAHELKAFSCPRFEREIASLQKAAAGDRASIESLQTTKSNLEGIVTQMKERHKEYIQSLEVEMERSLQYQQETLTAQHEGEISALKAQKAHEISELRRSHEQNIGQLVDKHTVAMATLSGQHVDTIRQLQTKQENQMEELHKQHQDKLEDITGRFDGIKMTLSEKVETLRSECDRLRDRAKHCEEALQRDSDFKVQCALAPYRSLPQEIESLKTVLEMKNEEINKLRTHNIELQKKLEELPVAREQIISLQQKKENLEAIISMKTDHEKVLHERCQSLMRKYDKESRANKRLSMDYEELMWKLSESFTDPDLGTLELYQKMGMSPTGDLTSPGLGRKLRTPSSSESSPSKSPATRRTLSSSADDREEKKMKRRSGNYLIDEMKHRATSPLAKQSAQNPLTKSWSAGSGSLSSSPTCSNGRHGTAMSQSWCVEMEKDENQTQAAVSKIPRSKSNTDKQSHGKSVSPEVSDRLRTEQVSVSKMETDNSNSNSVNGDVQTSVQSELVTCKSGESPQKSEPKAVPEMGPLSESDHVFNEKFCVMNNKHANADSDTNYSTSSITSVDTLRSETLSCPPSKLPVNIEEENDTGSARRRGHTETTV
ncbi:restin homolog isoform X2 [Dreissena polymorpha]|uniref:restin homolog isoform X2 n=1 Tax=Dreissena polymorpha TaxID=45954 RepID=UPI002263B100|nr:restin homolog isoform X2 [Dreissena polymorpha]